MDSNLRIVRAAAVQRTSVLLSPTTQKESNVVNILLIVIAVIAVILLITGGLGSTLHFLLWIGAVLLILAIIVFLVRFITNRRV
jgi:hypothetical protein